MKLLNKMAQYSLPPPPLTSLPSLKWYINCVVLFFSSSVISKPFSSLDEVGHSLAAIFASFIFLLCSEKESYYSLLFHLPSIICWCARKPWARSVFFTKSSGNGWFCKKKERESQSNGPLTHSRFCKISIQLLQTSHHLVSPAMWRLQLPWKPDHTHSPWQQKLHLLYHANEPRPPPSTHPLSILGNAQATNRPVKRRRRGEKERREEEEEETLLKRKKKNLPLF